MNGAGGQFEWLNRTSQTGKVLRPRAIEATKMRQTYAPGDWVVYRKSKRSSTPGPRAQQVVASSKGEKYSYVVEKFWVVESTLPDNQIVIRTRRGKSHQISADDPNLRRASLLSRILYRHRFLEVISAIGQLTSGSVSPV